MSFAIVFVVSTSKEQRKVTILYDGNGLTFQESVDLSKECDPLVFNKKKTVL